MIVQAYSGSPNSPSTMHSTPSITSLSVPYRRPNQLGVGLGRRRSISMTSLARSSSRNDVLPKIEVWKDSMSVCSFDLTGCSARSRASSRISNQSGSGLKGNIRRPIIPINSLNLRAMNIVFPTDDVEPEEKEDTEVETRLEVSQFSYFNSYVWYFPAPRLLPIRIVKNLQHLDLTEQHSLWTRLSDIDIIKKRTNKASKAVSIFRHSWRRMIHQRWQLCEVKASLSTRRIREKSQNFSGELRILSWLLSVAFRQVGRRRRLLWWWKSRKHLLSLLNSHLARVMSSSCWVKLKTSFFNSSQHHQNAVRFGQRVLGRLQTHTVRRFCTTSTQEHQVVASEDSG